MQKAIQISKIRIDDIRSSQSLNKLILVLLLHVAVISVFTGFAVGYKFIIGSALVLAILTALLLRYAEIGVFFIAIYFPFEEVILKFLPVSDQIFSNLRFGGEFLVYALFIAVVIRKLLRRQKVEGTPLDIALLLFVGVSVVSALVNNTSLIQISLFLRAILRYAFLFYAVANLGLSNDYVKKLVAALIVVGLVQVAIGFAQVTIGGPVNNFLKPRTSTLPVYGTTRYNKLDDNSREQGSIYGTAGDTISLSLFLMVTLALSTSLAFFTKNSYRFWLIFASLAFTLAIIYTYSRGTFLSVLFLLAVVLSIRRKKLLLLATVIASFIFLTLAPANTIVTANNNPGNQTKQSPIADFTQMFTNRYQTGASKAGRLYITRTASSEVLAKSAVLGFGPEYDVGWIKLLRDVYWIFILYKIGLAGLAAFVYLFFRLGQIAWYVYNKSTEQMPRIIALSYLALLGGVSLHNFFISVSEIRTVSLYFWLFAGLLAAYWNEMSREKPEEEGKQPLSREVSIRPIEILRERRPAKA